MFFFSSGSSGIVGSILFTGIGGIWLQENPFAYMSSLLHALFTMICDSVNLLSTGVKREPDMVVKILMCVIEACT